MAVVTITAIGCASVLRSILLFNKTWDNFILSHSALIWLLWPSFPFLSCISRAAVVLFRWQPKLVWCVRACERLLPSEIQHTFAYHLCPYIRVCALLPPPLHWQTTYMRACVLRQASTCIYIIFSLSRAPSEDSVAR